MRDLDRAIQLRRDFHWGLEPDAIIDLPAIVVPKTTVVLGFLKQVGYITAKAGDKDPVLYVHDFDEPNLPLLLGDPKTQNIFIHRYKSKFRIKPEGIVG
jgi:hypothetical protein